jgi:hypothetical protein
MEAVMRLVVNTKYKFQSDTLTYVKRLVSSMGIEHRFAYSNGHCIDIGPDEISSVRAA